MAIEGVDYTTAQRPKVAALKAAGKVFACRYGGPGGAWKHIDLAEVRELTAAGIAIVANAEGTADGLKGGRSAGVAWAQEAEQHFRALGVPADRPIYFSVDFDTTSGHWAVLDAAFDGIASVIGRDRVGVYGEYSIVKHLAGNGKARWFWQTYAWSSGQWYAGNHIEQYKNGVPLGGGTVDLNRAKTADYGQWGVDEDMGFLDEKQEVSGRTGAQMITDLWYAEFKGNTVSVEQAALKRIEATLAETLAAAKDDGNTTVVLAPEALAKLDELHAEVTSIPQQTADLVHADLAD